MYDLIQPREILKIAQRNKKITAKCKTQIQNSPINPKKTLALAVAFRKYIFCIGNLATPPSCWMFSKNIAFSEFFKNLKRYGKSGRYDTSGYVIALFVPEISPSVKNITDEDRQNRVF